MCSVLIFSRPSNNQLREDFQTGQPERGDVVDIHARDDWNWGAAIRTIGWWQEVVVIGAGMRELGGLLSMSRHDRSENVAGWRHRTWRVDLDELGIGQLDGGVWVVTLDRLLACAAPKPQATSVVALPSAIG